MSCGAIRGNDASFGDIDAGWAETLNNLIGRKPAVGVDELSTNRASCLQGNTLTLSPGEVCTYFVQRDDGAVRSLTLFLQRGQSAAVEIQQGDFSDDATLRGRSFSPEFEILPDDLARVVVTCAGTEACRLTVE